MLIVSEEMRAKLNNNYYCDYVKAECLSDDFDCENCKLYIEKNNKGGE